MKPSLEQVHKWDTASITYADEAADKFPCWEDARNMGLAELAAQWGAEQAQRPPVEEPKLPEAVAWQGRWLDQSDDAEGWSEWRAIDTIDLPRWQKRVTNKPGCYEIRALYTAAQMHDHFQAGVLAGMAQSQWQPIETAPKDGTKVLAYTNDGYKYPLVCQCVWGDGAWWPDVWESPDEPLSPTHWMPLLTPPAMQGGQQ